LRIEPTRSSAIPYQRPVSTSAEGPRAAATRGISQELAELARGSKQEASAAAAEQRELEARTPESRLRTQALREELKWKRREVQVGRALVDNDPVYLQVRRVGSFSESGKGGMRETQA
jgi:hypothetical protein